VHSLSRAVEAYGPAVYVPLRPLRTYLTNDLNVAFNLLKDLLNVHICSLENNCVSCTDDFAYSSSFEITTDLLVRNVLVVVKHWARETLPPFSYYFFPSIVDDSSV
jgi:hypothetical protein